MDCRRANSAIDDLLDSLITAADREALDSHLQHCPGCRRLLEQERQLQVAMRELPAPPAPPAGFADRVLHEAAACHLRHHRGRHQRFGLAIAATLVLGMALGLLLSPSPSPGPDPVSVPVNLVTLDKAQTRDVHLAFDAGMDLQDVIVVLHLPDQVELAGYPGQRSLQWRTDLAHGRNRLSLPLIAYGDEGGVVVAELSHGGMQKRFEVRVEVSPV